MPTPTNDIKPFGIGPGDDATSQADYLIASWRIEGWRSGILPHQQINKALRQSSVVASALAQTVADLTQQDVLDDGNLTALTNLIKTAFSAYLPYNNAVTYPTGSIGWAIQSGIAGGAMTGAEIRAALTGTLTAAEFSAIINGRLNLIDAPTTGLVTKVADLTTAYGSTVAAATSAAGAAAAQVAAETARNQAAVSAGAALTSQTNAATAATTATTAAGNASTSATNAASSATSSAGSASTASTAATTATGAATTAGNAATAAATSATTASTQATNASTSATTASTQAGTATTKAAEASTSATTAAGAATTATGAAATATTKANLAATSESNAAASATAASASATTASTQATAAGNSATTASAAALTATTKAADATSAATAAAGSATTASSASGAAGSSATAASGSAVTAQAAQAAASNSATTAGTAATTATTQAAAAVTSAANALASANAAGTSASASQTARLAAESAQAGASSSATAAAGSASTAAGSASTATTQAGVASTAATNAGVSASASNTSAATASTQATNATNSATAAADWYNQTVSATGTLTAAVTAEATTRASVDGGLLAQYALKVVATRGDGKKVFGYMGLQATAPNDNTGGQSEILMAADRLVFVPLSDTNAGPVQPFVVGLVNGVTTLMVNAAVIGDNVILPRSISTPNLAALSADLGNCTAGTLTLNSSGFVRGGQTDFDTGFGFFLGRAIAGGDFCLSLKADDGSYLRWSKTGGLQISGATLTAPTFTAFTASVTGYSASIFTGTTNLGSRTVSVSGGAAPYTYQWSLQDIAWTGATGDEELVFNTATTNAASTGLTLFTLSANGVTGRLVCTVIDSAGRVAVASANINVSIS